LKNFLAKNYLFLILIFLALLTRFVFLDYPSEVVFDEVHFGKFVSAYFTHQYYFDIHPPLGKLMIAGLARLNFAAANFGGFAQIGEVKDAHTLFILRFLPALFGAFLPLVFYGLVLVLGGSKKAGFLAGFLVVFDNAFLVESKFLLVDSFLFFFGFSSLLVFLISRKQENRFRKYLFYFLSMALAGLALSIKWTGLAFLGINLILSFIAMLKRVSFKRFLKFSFEVAVSLILVVIVYTLPFVIHFRMLTKSGAGDAFMSLDFQKTLSGSQLFQPDFKMSFWQKFGELNQKMWFYNSTLDKTHPDGSTFKEWPFLKKPVWYWSKTVNKQRGDIYLFGNPVLWLASLFISIVAVFKLKNSNKWILLLGFLASYLPFVFVSRVAFLYHYLPALGFLILLLALWSDRFPLAFYLGFSFLVFLSFVAISPLSYGFMLPIKASQIYQAILILFR